MLGLQAPWTSDGQRQVFRLLLEAWARPGTIADLGPWCGAGRARLAVLAALADAATTLAYPHGVLADGDRSRLGAATAEPSVATFVVADAVRPPGAIAPSRGTLLSPERGATLVLDCQAVGEGTLVRLAGPGIDGAQELHLLGVDPAWWMARRTWCINPLGVDLVLCDARRIACIPRSSHLET
jgi:alpha-D-ribose 1-methylphosphonate 5-triphosphate synthase subunit PhnH